MGSDSRAATIDIQMALGVAGLALAEMESQRQAIAPAPMLKWVQAARGLYNKLRSGTYTTAGGKPKPIHFDTRKLPYARGLTTDEKELLQDVKGMQGHMPGTIEVRRRIGRFLFGARVEMGEPLFITISPTTRHNTLCIKFSRYRAADPGGAADGARERPEAMGDGRSDHRRAAIRHSQTAHCEGSVGRRSQLPNRGAVHLRQTAWHPHVFSLPSMRLPRCTRTRVSRDGGHPWHCQRPMRSNRIPSQFHTAFPLQRVHRVHLATIFE